MARRGGTGWAFGAVSVLSGLLAACSTQAAAPTTTTRRAPPRTTTTTITTPPATTAPANAQLTVGTSSAAIGQTIVVSGTGCTPSFGGDVGVEIGVSGDAYNSAQGTRGTAVANADGSWSMNLPIDRYTPPGAQPLVADCGASGHADSWSYPTGTTITITTTYCLSVSPGTTVTAGTTLSVTGEGSCPIPSIPPTGFAQDAQVGIGANIDGIESFDGQSNGVANTWVGTDQLGNWSTTITVPATTPPGV